MIHEWKKCALLKLQEIEGQHTVYSHQKIIEDEERPSIFYTIPEKRLPMDEVIRLVEANLPLSLPEGDFSKQIVEKTLKLLERSKEKITTLSSLFVAVETNWGTIDEKHTRTKFYDHYHPPRGENDEINTLSYFSALHLESPVNESFNYVNLNELSLSGKPYRYWKENNPVDIAKDFQNLSAQVPLNEWKTLKFPETGALEIAFDSFYNLHSLTDLSGNLFLTIVINDVEMKEKLNRGDLHHRYFSF